MDDEQFFEFSRNTFKFFGLWAHNSKENQTLRTRLIRYVMFFLVGGIIPAASVSDVIETARTENVLTVLIKALYGIAYSMCFHKMVAVGNKSDEIFSCIRRLEMIACKFKDITDIRRSLNGYSKMTKIDSVATNICALVFMASPLVTKNLPYSPCLPFIDFDKSPNYEIMFIYQTLAVGAVANVMIAYDTIFCGLMYLCCGVLSSIRRDIRRLNIGGENEKLTEDAFKDIIEKINEASIIISQFSNIFSLTTMTSLLYNSSVMAFALLMISSLPLNDLTCITMMCCVFAVTFQMWIYCYFGQMVVDEKELLQTELYCTNWYNGSRNFRTMMLLTIFETQQVRFIKAGSILPLCLNTFAEAVKKAYAFYAFFKQVTV